MEELNLTKFDEMVSTLKLTVDRYKDVKIQGIEDKSGYELADRGRKELKSQRVELQKIGKAMRDNFTKINREIMSKEKELIELIEPLEIELKSQQDNIDWEKEKIERRKTLQEKKDKLKEINIELSDDELLKFTDISFNTFLIEKKEEYLAEKQRLIDEENLKIQRAKEIKEAEERATKQAEEKAKIEKEEAIKKEREKIEQERKQAEEKAKAEQDKLDADKKYKKFLIDNGYTEETKNAFYIERKDNKVILYKKVNELIIK